MPLLFLILKALPSDTLSTAYQDKWQASNDLSTDNAFIQWMASNELIYVVGAVSLIIWIGILYYLLRIEKSLRLLETKASNNDLS